MKGLTVGEIQPGDILKSHEDPGDNGIVAEIYQYDVLLRGDCGEYLRTLSKRKLAYFISQGVWTAHRPTPECVSCKGTGIIKGLWIAQWKCLDC